MEKIKSGLYVVATPIGNMEDITFRALETLKNVDFILCEDTRKAVLILNRFEFKKELVSFNARMEDRKTAQVLERIGNGESAALISDAGTPCISDPGVRIVNAAHKKNIPVMGLPGPSAAILALSVSGLPSDSFVFEGFIPQKKGRQKKLAELAEEPRTIILYESVYRIKKLIVELKEYMPERMVVITRELTKMFEEVIRGYPEELLEDEEGIKEKGEFVVLIGPKGWVEKADE